LFEVVKKASWKGLGRNKHRARILETPHTRKKGGGKKHMKDVGIDKEP